MEWRKEEGEGKTMKVAATMIKAIRLTVANPTLIMNRKGEGWRWEGLRQYKLQYKAIHLTINDRLSMVLPFTECSFVSFIPFVLLSFFPYPHISLFFYKITFLINSSSAGRISILHRTHHTSVGAPSICPKLEKIKNKYIYSLYICGFT